MPAQPSDAPLPPLIPFPAELERCGGRYRATPGLRAAFAAGTMPPSPEASAIACLASLPLREGVPQPGDVVFAIDEHAPPDPESYALDALPGGLSVRARSPEGLVRGAATVRQLLPSTPALQIRDHPRHRWRGLLLDSARHFQSVDFVKATIDRLAEHKLNRFHWHLTEDQGWRLEIDAFPELCRVGAFRREADGTPYGGYYTKDDVREVVAHARARHVVVVPEIEMPGHCLAALAARPELSCTGGPHEVPASWGIFDEVYCAGNDEVFRFLERVLDEVLDLFPGPWIHLGGDECPKTRWLECPRCLQRMRDEGLGDGDELQSWFLRRIVRRLAARGRTAIGWDEIHEGGLPPGAIVQSWRGFDGARAAVRAGHDAISSPTSHTYLDYPTERTSLRKAYTFDPVPMDLPADVRHRVLGGEAAMWTEYAPQETLWPKMFPRLLALAERLWTPRELNYDAFLDRVLRHRPRLESLGVSYGEDG